MFDKPTLDPQFSKQLWVQWAAPLCNKPMGTHLVLGICQLQKTSIQAHGKNMGSSPCLLL